MTQLTEAYDHIDEIKSLFSEYTAMLVSIDPSFSIYLDIQHYDDEALDPAAKYAMPNGRLYLAIHDGKTAGCIALRPLSDDRCELKRLYVRPEFRGTVLPVCCVGEYLRMPKRPVTGKSILIPSPNSLMQ